MSPGTASRREAACVELRCWRRVASLGSTAPLVGREARSDSWAQSRGQLAVALLPRELTARCQARKNVRRNAVRDVKTSYVTLPLVSDDPSAGGHVAHTELKTGGVNQLRVLRSARAGERLVRADRVAGSTLADEHGAWASLSCVPSLRSRFGGARFGCRTVPRLRLGPRVDRFGGRLGRNLAGHSQGARVRATSGSMPAGSRWGALLSEVAIVGAVA